MQLCYELTSDDLIVFSKEGVKGTSFYNQQVAIIVVIAIIFMASDMLLLIVSVFLNDGSVRVGDLGTSIFLKVILWAVLMGGIWAVLMLIARHGAKKASASHLGVNGVFCEHSIEIDENGFTEITDVNRSFYAWKSIESVRETDNLVLITIRLGAIHIIPKRSFESDLHRNSFVAAVDEHIVCACVPPPPPSA